MSIEFIFSNNATLFGYFRLKEKKILDSVLGKEGRYDKRIRPAGVNSTGSKLNISTV